MSIPNGPRQTLLLALLLLPPLVLAVDSDPHLTARQLQQLQQRIGNIQGQIEELRGQRHALEGELRGTERRISSLAQSIHRLNGRIDEQRRELARIQQDTQQQGQRLLGNQQALRQQVRAAYISGQEAYLKLLLSQRDPQRMGRMLVYYDYINHARAGEIEGLQQTLQRLEQLSQRKQTAQAALQQSLQSQQRDKAAMEQSQARRQGLLAQLAVKLEDKEVELAQLQEDEQQLHKLLNDLNTALSDIPAVPRSLQAFARLKGKLDWPLQGAVTERYGSPRSAGLSWKGVMLDASKDHRVRAISHGRVAFSDWLRGYGLLTILDHGDGYMSLYGQNHSLYKKPGEWVQAGEVIAEAGELNSGQARLYFEIRHQGKPQNPQRWCRR